LDLERVLFAAFVAAYVSGSVWFYLHCVRPALRWNRARWSTHLVFGALAVVPVVAVVLPSWNATWNLVALIAFLGQVAAFTFPAAVTRATGGWKRLQAGEREVHERLGEAGAHLDLGDLEAAKAEVEEARRSASAELVAYVDLWEALVSEEDGRRRGQRISRGERLSAIHAEYARLRMGPDAIPPRLEATIVVGTAALALISLVGRWS
jgi:hypothetical protein